MNNIDIPAHQSHLQSKDSRVRTVVGHDKFNGITIRNPYKPLSKEILPTLVDGEVACESFAKVGMQPRFVATRSAGSEANWIE
jgi:hypothetical protein